MSLVEELKDAFEASARRYSAISKEPYAGRRFTSSVGALMESVDAMVRVFGWNWRIDGEPSTGEWHGGQWQLVLLDTGRRKTFVARAGIVEYLCAPAGSYNEQVLQEE